VTTAALDRLRSANPVAGAIDAPEEWRDELFRRLAAIPPPGSREHHGRSRRRLLLAAAVMAALLAVPSYALARTVIEWVRGAPAPQAVVNEFESYAPQLGYRPDASGAILVAVEGNGVRLYSTPNDKGSYCLVLRAPGRPTGDGGTCIQPAWAAEPLIAGTLGATGGDETASTQFIAGRATSPHAANVEFAGPTGESIRRPIGFDGFFVASVRVPRAACGAGDWRPTFVVSDAAGGEVERADITLLFSYPAKGVCGFVPPHPPHVR
jgi:hypothetical protein